MAMYKVNHICENEDALNAVLSLFRTTPGVTMSSVQAISKSELNGSATYHVPRMRRSKIQKLVLSTIEIQPGLCTRRLMQLPALKSCSQSSITNSLYRSKSKGYLVCREENGLGGWYITDACKKILNNDNPKDHIVVSREQYNGSKSPIQSIILKAAKELANTKNGEPFETKEIINMLPGHNKNGVCVYLSRLTEDKQLKRISKGKYVLGPKFLGVI